MYKLYRTTQFLTQLKNRSFTKDRKRSMINSKGGEIRQSFIGRMREDFKTQYGKSVNAFLRWYVGTYGVVLYRIVNESSLFDMFFVISRTQKWHNNVT